MKPLHLTDPDGDGIGATVAAEDLAAAGVPGAVVVVSTHENGDWTGAALTAPQVQELIDWFSAATANTSGSSPTDLEGVTDFRRRLLVASTSWHRRFEAAMTKDDGTANPGDCMAASYAYTLAAALKVVEVELGAEAAQSVARIAQELLDNGDFDDWNADVSGLDPK